MNVNLSTNPSLVANFSVGGRGVAQLVEQATPGEEVVGLIPAVATRSLLFWVGVSLI